MSKDISNETEERKNFSNANKYIAITFAAILATSLFMVSLMGGVANAQQPTAMQSNVIRDSILLAGPRTIPAGDFIHVYDSTPYKIMSGHVAIKVPCDANSHTQIQVLTGQAPNLKPSNMELIKPLSTPGQQCLYHVDLPGNNSTITTDVAIKNAGTQDIYLTGTSSIFVGVNEIMPGAEEAGGHEHSEMNMTGMNMTS